MQVKIIVELPVRSKPIISITGKGPDKIRAMAMHEQITPILSKLFHKWFIMQAKEADTKNLLDV
jgi:hypothetical protein